METKKNRNLTFCQKYLNDLNTVLVFALESKHIDFYAYNMFVIRIIILKKSIFLNANDKIEKKNYTNKIVALNGIYFANFRTIGAQLINLESAVKFLKVIRRVKQIKSKGFTQSRIIGAVRGAHSQLWWTIFPVFSPYAPRKYDKRFGTPAIV